MNDVSRLFTNRIPTKTEIKKHFKGNKDTNFKLLLKLEKEFRELNEKNILKYKTVNNIFAYLKENIVYKRVNNTERIVYILLTINANLTDKLKSGKNKSVEYKESINQIKLNIEMLLLHIAHELETTTEDLVKVTLFNRVMYTIFNKRDLKKSLDVINNNIEILNYHDFAGGTFNSILAAEFYRAKEAGNKGMIEYYLRIIKHASIFSQIEIDREYFRNILLENIMYDNNEYLKYDDKFIRKMKEMPFNKNNQRYVPNDFIFTIDANDTKAFDDAFSIEKHDNCYILGIHIADVYSLGFNDKVVLEGEQYSRSTGHNKASLDQDINRSAVSLYIQFDKDGVILNTMLIPTKINVGINMDYNDFNEIFIRGGENNEKFKKLNEEQKKYLLDQLQLLFDAYLVIDNKNFTLHPTSSNLAVVIVSKFMMLYGSLISNQFSEKGYPYIYLNGSVKNHYFSLENKGYDTGFKDYRSYGRATSPIYDRPSLVSQVLIHELLLKNNNDKDIGKYERLLKPISNKFNKS